ncbi:MAG: cytochrome c-type biogenesis protein CcmE [Candidatus Tokpelaia sp. JSC161]|jgi:cytochrome c-type biogenesis protein CcmE|nr:MAG: cytochrome c-type biogenesis protein CcmE [Candidatus Tokpelaia sp. JSC161]
MYQICSIFHRRQFWIIFGAVCLVLSAISFIVVALRQTSSFFRLPSEITQRDRVLQRSFRIAGDVGRIEYHSPGEIRFRVADVHSSEEVSFRGIVPDFFHEGQSVIVEGHFIKNIFVAERLLVRHDEKYRAKDMVEYGP